MRHVFLVCSWQGSEYVKSFSFWICDLLSLSLRSTLCRARTVRTVDKRRASRTSRLQKFGLIDDEDGLTFCSLFYYFMIPAGGPQNKVLLFFFWDSRGYRVRREIRMVMGASPLGTIWKQDVMLHQKCDRRGSTVFCSEENVVVPCRYGIPI